MTPRLVFNIQTIPDIAGLRTLLDVPAHATDTDIANIAFHQRRQHNGSEHLPLHQHKVCAISCALREKNQFRVWSLGDANSSEAEIIQGFFDCIDQYSPQLISWSGSDFDLPVLSYRTLINKVQAPNYWNLSEEDSSSKKNNCINLDHARHLDLMNVLALFNSYANAPLTEIAQLCGFPGQVGMDSSQQVWRDYQAGEFKAIRNDCEADVVNAHLVYLRFQLMRGHLTPAVYEAEINLVRHTLGAHTAPHWAAFLAAWKS
jgi:hypothetical protein